jgi:hypothetical protein
LALFDGLVASLDTLYEGLLASLVSAGRQQTSYLKGLLVRSVGCAQGLDVL